MKLAQPKSPGPEAGKKLQSVFSQFEKILAEIEKQELPKESISFINNEVSKLNQDFSSERKWRGQIRKVQEKVLEHMEKELKLVPKKYYTNKWMALGMTIYGLPIGAALGLLSDNMGLIGIGLPIGLAIGMGIGQEKDKKAAAENRQMDVEITYQF